MGTAYQPGGARTMNNEYWSDWLTLLILLHDQRTTYPELLAETFEQWRDQCVLVDHNLMVGRLYA